MSDLGQQIQQEIDDIKALRTKAQTPDGQDGDPWATQYEAFVDAVQTQLDAAASQTALDAKPDADTDTQLSNSEVQAALVAQAILDEQGAVTADVNNQNTTSDVTDTQELSVNDGPVISNLVGTNLSVTDGVLNAVGSDSGGYTDEQAQDAVNTMLSGGTNVALDYDDTNNTLTISASGGSSSQLSDEEVQDIVGGFVAGSGATSVSYDDANNTLTISSTDTDTQLTDSEVQVAVNNDADHGSTASHNYFSGSHNDLSDVSAGDHHAKTVASDLAGANLTASGGQLDATDTDTNTQAYSLTASGSTTLSSGSGTVDTSVTTGSTPHQINVEPGGADIAVSLDGSGTNYVIHIEENTTSVGNPTVGWQLVESNL